MKSASNIEPRDISYLMYLQYPLRDSLVILIQNLWCSFLMIIIDRISINEMKSLMDLANAIPLTPNYILTMNS